MKVTREVVTDLLPAYLADRASADTRALVKQFAQRDAEFARLLLVGLAERRDGRARARREAKGEKS